MDHSEGVLYFTFYFCRVLIENACDASYPRARNSDKRIRSFNNYDTHDHNQSISRIPYSTSLPNHKVYKMCRSSRSNGNSTKRIGTVVLKSA